LTPQETQSSITNNAYKRISSIYSSPSSEDYDNLKYSSNANNYKIEDGITISSPVIEKPNTFLKGNPSPNIFIQHNKQRPNINNVTNMTIMSNQNNTINLSNLSNHLIQNHYNTTNKTNKPISDVKDSIINNSNIFTPNQTHQSFNPIISSLTNVQTDFRKKFKTEICKFYELNKECKFGDKVFNKFNIFY